MVFFVTGFRAVTAVLILHTHNKCIVIHDENKLQSFLFTIECEYYK